LLVITLIHGPAELLRAEALAALRERLGDDPALIEVNTSILDGRKAPLSELENICETLPFLATYRLVIVEGLVRRLSGSQKTPPDARAPDDAEQGASESAGAQSRRFLDLLQHMPETTELVLIEEEVISGGPLLRRLMELQRAGQAHITLCQKPGRNDLMAWIRKRAIQRNVRLDAEALNDLTEYVGDDLRQLDQELIKLADYAAGKTVTRADVRLLVAATRAASIFELVDALGTGDTPRAARLMRHILDVDGEQPLIVLTMIGRQFRLLLQAKAMQANAARPPEVAHALGVPDWTASKLLSQATRYTFAGLQKSMEHVLAADEAIKTGKMSDREAMDVLLAQLAYT
jgi:DNA polymerase-3 subunit delta